jgi:hypothetical protein
MRAATEWAVGCSQGRARPAHPLFRSARPPRPTCSDGAHVGLAATLDHAPLGALREVEQVVVDPEADQHLHGELKHLRVGHAPNSGAHGQHVVAAEGLGVAVGVQVGAQGDVAVGPRHGGLQHLRPAAGGGARRLVGAWQVGVLAGAGTPRAAGATAASLMDAGSNSDAAPAGAERAPGYARAPNRLLVAHLGRLLAKAHDVVHHAQEGGAQRIGALGEHGVEVADRGPAAFRGVAGGEVGRLPSRVAAGMHQHARVRSKHAHHSSLPSSMDSAKDMSEGSVSTPRASRKPTRWG